MLAMLSLQHAVPAKPGTLRPCRTRVLACQLALFSLSLTGLWAQTNPTAQALADKETCTRNFEIIYQAVQAYQAEHKDLPNWLSDLVPKYINDTSILVCPVCQRTGQTEEPKLADPKLPASYLWEFIPVPLNDDAPNARHRTRREWKRRQMGVVGSAVPIVRCRHHQPVLNLAFDGRIYESPAQWELAFTNRVGPDSLSAPKLFADEPPPSAQSAPLRFPARDPKAKPGQLDLTRFYNAQLSDSLHGQANNSLALLPAGLRTLAGVEFDLRGVIQLGGRGLTDAKSFPVSVKTIPLKQKCRRLHFLHAAGPGSAADNSKQIASYTVKFTGNPARLEIPVVYGRDLLDWRASDKDSRSGPDTPTVAWSATDSGRNLRLYKTTWTNFAPDLEIESIDFTSSMNGPAPFLLAITAE